MRRCLHVHRCLTMRRCLHVHRCFVMRRLKMRRGLHMHRAAPGPVRCTCGLWTTPAGVSAPCASGFSWAGLPPSAGRLCTPGSNWLCFSGACLPSSGCSPCMGAVPSSPPGRSVACGACGSCGVCPGVPAPAGFIAPGAAFMGGLALESDRPRGRGDGRMAVIGRGEAGAVHAGSAHMLGLPMRRRMMRLARRGFFRRRRPHRQAAPAAVVADPIVVDDDRLLIDVGDLSRLGGSSPRDCSRKRRGPNGRPQNPGRHSHSRNRRRRRSRQRPPIAAMEHIGAVRKAPIGRRPEKLLFRRFHPGAWHPVIIDIVPGPIARRPDITGPRDRRLIIFWQRRGSLLQR